ncbi:hypothetical protein BK139_23335, partial [Paenibacillus sp. FSL R5-0490]
MCPSEAYPEKVTHMLAEVTHICTFQLKRRVQLIQIPIITHKKKHPSGALSCARQRPTLTGGQPPTTIGAEKL